MTHYLLNPEKAPNGDTLAQDPEHYVKVQVEDNSVLNGLFDAVGFTTKKTIFRGTAEAFNAAFTAIPSELDQDNSTPEDMAKKEAAERFMGIGMSEDAARLASGYQGNDTLTAILPMYPST